MERLAVKRNMTIIAVAHRLATIQKADSIFVFGESVSYPGSEILERGTHRELLRNKGPYWQMVCSQDSNGVRVKANRKTVPGTDFGDVDSYFEIHHMQPPRGLRLVPTSRRRIRRGGYWLTLVIR
jgi:hypothetical protein